MIRALVATAVVLACVGCSDGSDEPASSASDTASASASEATPTAPTSSAAAADGPEISGTGYSYHVPKGWGRPPQEVPGFDPDSLAGDLEDEDGFTDNVNVIISPAGELTPEQAEGAAQSELESAGADDPTVQDRLEVAGSESAHVTAGMSRNGNDYTIEQFYPSDDGRTFVVTFSFSNGLTAEERAAVTDAVLASWTWTD